MKRKLFQNEAELEKYIRNAIAKISRANLTIRLLENKGLTDIVACRDGNKPTVFFLEVKYYQKSHGRLGFGGKDGGGFQPEVVLKKPRYFERKLRWLLASKEHSEKGILFIDSATIRKHLSGGKVGLKFNNIKTSIFTKEKGYSKGDLIIELKKWFKE
jgi:hypothetical protein